MLVLSFQSSPDPAAALNRAEGILGVRQTSAKERLQSASAVTLSSAPEIIGGLPARRTRILKAGGHTGRCAAGESSRALNSGAGSYSSEMSWLFHVGTRHAVSQR
jgi:hypothetical protein